MCDTRIMRKRLLHTEQHSPKSAAVRAGLMSSINQLMSRRKNLTAPQPNRDLLTQLDLPLRALSTCNKAVSAHDNMTTLPSRPTTNRIAPHQGSHAPLSCFAGEGPGVKALALTPPLLPPPPQSQPPPRRAPPGGRCGNRAASSSRRRRSATPARRCPGILGRPGSCRRCRT